MRRTDKEIVDRRQSEGIMRQYSGTTWPFESASVAKVRVWKITITSMTGKQSKPQKAEVS
jgi:hypothetical protein